MEGAVKQAHQRLQHKGGRAGECQGPRQEHPRGTVALQEGSTGENMQATWATWATAAELAPTVPNTNLKQKGI